VDSSLPLSRTDCLWVTKQVDVTSLKANVVHFDTDVRQLLFLPTTNTNQIITRCRICATKSTRSLGESLSRGSCLWSPPLGTEQFDVTRANPKRDGLLQVIDVAETCQTEAPLGPRLCFTNKNLRADLIRRKAG